MLRRSIRHDEHAHVQAAIVSSLTVADLPGSLCSMASRLAPGRVVVTVPPDTPAGRRYQRQELRGRKRIYVRTDEEVRQAAERSEDVGAPLGSIKCMRNNLLGLALVVAAAAGPGCGGGDGTTAATTAPPAPTTTVPATTTTVVTVEAFNASICAAGFSIADAKPGAAGGYKLTAETYGKVVPTPEKKADLDAFVQVNQALAALWSDPNPTTPEAFSDQYGKLNETYLAAIQKLQVECPPRPGVTTTVATAIKANRQLYAVAREGKGKGLWWYTSFACPEGKKLKLGPDMTAPKGEPKVGAVLDEAAGVADPFTGVLANDSYGRIDEKVTATCV